MAKVESLQNIQRRLHVNAVTAMQIQSENLGELPPMTSFVCCACGGTFDKAWSDMEAAAEALETFGINEIEQGRMVVVCDDCFRRMTTALPLSELKHGE